MENRKYKKSKIENRKSKIENLKSTILKLKILKSKLKNTLNRKSKTWNLKPKIKNCKLKNQNKKIKNSNISCVRFGTGFCQKIDDLPPSLTHLIFPWDCFFDEIIQKLPPKLVYLVLGRRAIHPFTHTLPITLFPTCRRYVLLYIGSRPTRCSCGS